MFTLIRCLLSSPPPSALLDSPRGELPPALPRRLCSKAAGEVRDRRPHAGERDFGALTHAAAAGQRKLSRERRRALLAARSRRAPSRGWQRREGCRRLQPSERTRFFADPGRSTTYCLPSLNVRGRMCGLECGLPESDPQRRRAGSPALETKPPPPLRGSGGFSTRGRSQRVRLALDLRLLPDAHARQLLGPLLNLDQA